MYEREVGCPRSGGSVSAWQQRHRRERGTGCIPSVGKGLLVLGCTAASLAISLEVLAQGTLPPVTIEGKISQKNKANVKAAAPTKQAEPRADAPETAQSRDKAKAEAVYNTPAAV